MARAYRANLATGSLSTQAGLVLTSPSESPSCRTFQSRPKPPTASMANYPWGEAARASFSRTAPPQQSSYTLWLDQVAKVLTPRGGRRTRLVESAPALDCQAVLSRTAGQGGGVVTFGLDWRLGRELLRFSGLYEPNGPEKDRLYVQRYRPSGSDRGQVIEIVTGTTGKGCSAAR